MLRLALALTALAAPVAAQQSDEEVIRAARAASNRAIAAHDADALAVTWMEDYHITPSTSDLLAGREANRRLFVELFRSRPDVVYVRTPDSVAVNRSWAVAAEQGHWTGQWTQAGASIRIGGSYYAQWRKSDGRWLIQAEVFVPTWCEGGVYCAQRP
ncbi:MAG TPA: nuclear transport factor 2 family protein [Gemmatimonadales bacterium]|nr:nuclear transport factor 2 family protein [Gemmatimonadales bacterium]